MDQYNMILDSEIKKAFGNADFGKHYSNREIVNNSLLKCASGYYTGFTAKCILEKLKLVTKEWTLTERGKEYLFEAYSNGVSI
jgi:hypothetical protein